MVGKDITSKKWVMELMLLEVEELVDGVRMTEGRLDVTVDIYRVGKDLEYMILVVIELH
jgi:hypothetical protein